MKKKIAKPRSKASMREYSKLRKAMKKLQKETTLAFIANIVPAPEEPNQPDDIV
jgi:hypothetical protein